MFCVETLAGLVVGWLISHRDSMPNTDAYGALLIAHEEAGDDIEIVERDDGFIDAHEGVWHYFTEFDDWFEEEQETIG